MYKLPMNQNHKLLFLIVTLFLLIVSFSQAQNVKDSSLFISMVKFSYAVQAPSGDMAKRFGVSSAVALNFSMKTKRNLYFGFDGSFVFGNNIKEVGILDSLKTSSGFIITQNGNPATVRLFERGYGASVHIGKLFNLFYHNKNSGILVYAGPTYFQHKIKIDDIGRQTAELVESYKKGYDRLTSGFGFHEFIGYVYLSNNRILNFFGGFDCMQAFTKSQRSYDFDLMKADTRNRLDLLSGIRIGWILPLYRSTPQQYYYQ
jgi:hypothetical protein